MRVGLLFLLVIPRNHIDTILSSNQDISRMGNQNTPVVELSVLQAVKTVITGVIKTPSLLVLDHIHHGQSVVGYYPYMMIQILCHGAGHTLHLQQLICLGVIHVHAR